MEGLRRNYLQLISPILAKRLIYIITFVFLFDYLFFALPVFAAESGVFTAEVDPVNRELYLISDRGDEYYLESADKRFSMNANDDHLIVVDNNIAPVSTPTSIVKQSIENNERVNQLIQLENKASFHLPVNNVKVKQEVTKKPVSTKLTYKKVTGKHVVSMTAYNSEKGQTDNSPCTTANGFNVCQHGVEDTIAANFLPFGAKVKIPALFGDRIFVVRDRMNKRYSNRVDVWMKNRSDALRFGVRTTQIEIVE